MQAKITKRAVDALNPVDRDLIVWDTELRGFGLRCRVNGGKFYVLKYRTTGRQRWVTLGRHGSLTPEIARQEARKLLGDVARGEDPADTRDEDRRDLTVTELCDIYVAEGCATKKATTISTDRGRIERHIKPLLGARKVRTVTRAHVERMMADIAAGRTATDEKTGFRGRAIVKGGRGTATKAVTLLGAIFTFAVNRGVRLDNPCRGVRTFRPRKHERFLSLAELGRLGEALGEAENTGENRNAIAALRLLAFTGCRKTEVLSLRWDYVDFERGCLRLPDSKTGARVIPLGAPALELLSSLPRFTESGYVFPATTGDGHFVGLPKIWRRIRDRAGLSDVRLHDLRHSFAAVGASGGDSLLMIGKLLGHNQAGTTQRYAHLADDPLKAAVDRISGTVAAAMNANQKAKVVSIKQGRIRRTE